MAIYLWRNGDKAGGLAVLSCQSREVTLVNIVGTIDLEQLRMLQGKFGVPDLKMEDAAEILDAEACLQGRSPKAIRPIRIPPRSARRAPGRPRRCDSGARGPS